MDQQRILAMTNEQYDAQVASAKRELRRLKEEVKELAERLRKISISKKR